MPIQRVLAIVGPTAAGKSALAIRAASQLGGEIVSADSRQVYRYMDIGTAKPSAAQRAEVRHHLIDIVDPDEDFSLALFLRHAKAAIQDILERSKLPIVAGGSGQYVWALLEGWQVPHVPPDETLRRALEEKARAEGAAALHQELARLDPDKAGRLDPRNARRVIRALEVHYSSPERSRRVPRVAPPFEPLVIGLTLERTALYRRVDERVDAMIEQGWVREVEGLLASGYHAGLPSLSSLGYQELARHLRGEESFGETVEMVKRKTRRFTRQQLGWFRPADPRVHWFDGSPGGSDAALALAREMLAREPAR